MLLILPSTNSMGTEQTHLLVCRSVIFQTFLRRLRISISTAISHIETLHIEGGTFSMTQRHIGRFDSRF